MWEGDTWGKIITPIVEEIQELCQDQKEKFIVMNIHFELSYIINVALLKHILNITHYYITGRANVIFCAFGLR